MTYAESQFQAAKFMAAQIPYIRDSAMKKRVARNVLVALREFLAGD